VNSIRFVLTDPPLTESYYSYLIKVWSLGYISLNTYNFFKDFMGTDIFVIGLESGILPAFVVFGIEVIENIVQIRGDVDIRIIILRRCTPRDQLRILSVVVHPNLPCLGPISFCRNTSRTLITLCSNSFVPAFVETQFTLLTCYVFLRKNFVENVLINFNIVSVHFSFCVCFINTVIPFSFYPFSTS